MSWGLENENMNPRIGTIIVVALMVATSLAVIVEADPAPLGWPTGATNWIGPRPQDDCSVAQALGYGGTESGTTTGYHSYTQGTGIGALDACFNAAGIPGFANCVVMTQTDADNNGV